MRGLCPPLAQLGQRDLVLLGGPWGAEAQWEEGRWRQQGGCGGADGSSQPPQSLFNVVPLNRSSRASKGEFSRSLLVTQGVKDPSHSMSHPHFLSQLVVWLSGMCTVLLHTCYDVPVLHAGDATAAPGEELLGHVVCAGLSDYGLPLFYKTLSRKDGLIAISKSPVLIC